MHTHIYIYTCKSETVMRELQLQHMDCRCCRIMNAYCCYNHHDRHYHHRRRSRTKNHLPATVPLVFCRPSPPLTRFVVAGADARTWSPWIPIGLPRWRFRFTSTYIVYSKLLLLFFFFSQKFFNPLTTILCTRRVMRRYNGCTGHCSHPPRTLPSILYKPNV